MTIVFLLVSPISRKIFKLFFIICILCDLVIRTFCCLILIWHPLTFYVAFCDLSLPLLTHVSATVLGTSGNTNVTLSPHCLNPMAAYHPWD